MIVQRGMVVACSIVLSAASAGIASGAWNAAPPPPSPPGIPPMPSGPQQHCKTTGPAWVAYGIHTPNAPPIRGNQYRVTAWGITCAKTTQLLRVLAPKIPPNRTTVIPGAPAGFTCKSHADGS